MTEVRNPRPATYLPKKESTLLFPAQQTALLVIDPVNDFLSEGGAGLGDGECVGYMEAGR
jgi:hypothetical protein